MPSAVLLPSTPPQSPLILRSLLCRKIVRAGVTEMLYIKRNGPADLASDRAAVHRGCRELGGFMRETPYRSGKGDIAETFAPEKDPVGFEGSLCGDRQDIRHLCDGSGALNFGGNIPLVIQ